MHQKTIFNTISTLVKTIIMQIISLFGGIEGFGLAGHKMGWNVVASVEWEEFPQMVIKKNFPNTEIHGDIKQFDGRKYRGTIDIVCGGFPCQPYSLAGKRKGKDDDRHLWPQMLRVIREVQPTWVIGENVPGLVNWSEGVVFEEVQSDLEAEGYEVQSFILPAAGVGAPHRRDRVWIVAYSYSIGHRGGNMQSQPDKQKEREVYKNQQHRDRIWGQTEGCSAVASNPNSGRLPSQKHRQAQSGWFAETSFSTDWQNFPTQSPVCNGNDGISAGLVRYILRTGGDCYTEEEAEKEAKRIISKVRAEGIKAGGNAIVHQVALQIFKAIEEFENLHSLMKGIN